MDVNYLVLAGTITYGSVMMIIKWQKWLQITDDPHKNKESKNTHDYPVPRGGGLVLGLGTMVPLWIWARNWPQTYFILGCILILMVIGYMDDRWQNKVSPYVRLLINIGVALMTWVGGMGIKYVTGWGGEIWWLSGTVGLLATVLWLVWMQNIVGWSSGVDGQLPGFVIVAAVVVGIWGGVRPGFIAPPFLPVLAWVTTGAFVGFLYWNWYPQKIMPGYGGKALAGYLLGLIAILADVKLSTMAMVLAVPFVDAVFAIMKRVLEGRSPVWGGRDHLHHYLLDRGWGKRRVAGFYWITSFLGGMLALRLKVIPAYFTMATVILVITGLILWLRNWSSYSKRPDQDSG